LKWLREGGEALDAVEAAAAWLEDNALLNAGHGAVYGDDGKHYLAAAFYEGKGTGRCEQYIRFTVAYDVDALVAYKGWSIQEAAEETVFKKLKKGDGGVLVEDEEGNVAIVFNTEKIFRTENIFRGWADSKGRHEVAL
jgi:isoaspartyl peptidase/L-asparaginase-like protein (Ntn-hydrolase superfamily)